MTPGLSGGSGGAYGRIGDLRSEQGEGVGKLGIRSEMLTPPESVTTDEMLALIAELNAREDVDSILIQLPLPKRVDTRRLLEAVDPAKDVDGFHPVNAGRLQSGQPGLRPCTPAGIMEILRRSGLEVAGKHAVVWGGRILWASRWQ